MILWLTMAEPWWSDPQFEVLREVIESQVPSSNVYVQQFQESQGLEIHYPERMSPKVWRVRDQYGMPGVLFLESPPLFRMAVSREEVGPGPKVRPIFQRKKFVGWQLVFKREQA